MSSFDDAELFEDNPDPRIACCLLLDTSYSMSGAPIKELNGGLQAFQQAINEDERARRRAEVCVIRFGPVDVVYPFGPVEQLANNTLEADGATPMGEAITTGQNGIEYYRPWMFLITDGAPTDDGADFYRAQTLLHEAVAQKRLTFFPIGVQDADMEVLKKLGNGKAFRIQGLNFREFFIWLSRSMSQVSAANPGAPGGVNLQKPSDNVMTIEI